MKKFQMTDKKSDYSGEIYYRIQALRDIPRWNVKKGDMGGCIQKEESLSQENDCWIDDGVLVDKNSIVTGEVLIEDIVTINNSEISGTMIIKGNVTIKNSEIHGVQRGNLTPYINKLASITDSTINGYFEITDDVRVKNSDLRMYSETGSFILSGTSVLQKVRASGDISIKNLAYLSDVRATNARLIVYNDASLKNVVIDGEKSSRPIVISLYENAMISWTNINNCEVVTIFGNGKIEGSPSYKITLINSAIRLIDNVIIKGITKIANSFFWGKNDATLDSMILSRGELRMEGYSTAQYAMVKDQKIKMIDFAMLKASDYKEKNIVLN